MAGRSIEIWNAHDDVQKYVGAQSITNILGRVNGSVLPEKLTYSLNGDLPQPVYVKRSADEAPRLVSIGDFNIDTVTKDMLQSVNTVVIKAQYADNTSIEKSVRFPILERLPDRHSLKARLQEASYPEQVGQVVDGGWVVSTDEHGRKCIELAANRAGYDRIILLSGPALGPDYTVRARLCVTSWHRALHNVGLVFHWNPHLQGDGKTLPEQWSTGLAYYHSGSKGLRFRVGVDVHFDENGEKVGGHTFAEEFLKPWRAHYNHFIRRMRMTAMELPQLENGKLYDFELQVQSRYHSLTVWPTGTAHPKAQVVVPNLPDLLSGQVAGIIAHYGAVRVYEFEIKEGR